MPRAVHCAHVNLPINKKIIHTRALTRCRRLILMKYNIRIYSFSGSHYLPAVTSGKSVDLRHGTYIQSSQKYIVQCVRGRLANNTPTRDAKNNDQC